MFTEPHVRRVIVTVLDGLRPDAIDAFELDALGEYRTMGAYTSRAQTVLPSVTAAAMSSLLTGLTPQQHGLTSDRFHIPRPRQRLEPLPAWIAGTGLPVSTFVRELPLLFRALGRASAGKLGVQRPTFRGTDSASILDAARITLRSQRDGLIVLHWPDADIAGHADGWMSSGYGAACRRLDRSLADMVDATRVLQDPESLLIVLADHGGGGVNSHDHDGDHPDNTTIPVLVLGGAVCPQLLDDDVTILDIAPTVTRALGIAAAPSWPGRAIPYLLEPALAG